MVEINSGEGRKNEKPDKEESIKDLISLPSVDEEKAEVLYENDFYSPEDIVERGMKGLSEIYMFGFETAKQILKEAREYEKDEEEEIEETVSSKKTEKDVGVKSKQEGKEKREKIKKAKQKEEPLFRPLKFNHSEWNLGGKLIFYSTVIAILSNILPWARDMSSFGFEDGTTLFLLFYIYPFIALTMDKPIHDYLGYLMGIFGILFPTVLYFFYPGRPLIDEMSYGFILFIAACIILILGVGTYERYERHLFEEKEMVIETKECSDCGSKMEYVDNLERWYCEKCDELK